MKDERRVAAPRLIRARFASLLIALVNTVGGAPTAKAWGPEGHEVVASIAERHLSAGAKRRVDALLALEPGATLAGISHWADEARDRTTARWHYVNFPRDANCVYAAARDCPDGDCVVAALEAKVRRLASAPTPVERLEALKYVVHFVADVHQPLHAGFREDRGGNTWQLQAFGHGTNLHAVWDSTIVASIDRRARSLAISLDSAPVPTASLSFAPALWAFESCRIVSRPDFYPGREVDGAYLRRFEPVVRARLQLAGLRLAAALNGALGSAQPP